MTIRALITCVALAGCSYQVAGYCDEDTPCEEPAPFCDVEGAYPASGGIGNTCIPDPFDAGAQDAQPTDASASGGLVDLQVSVGVLEPAFDPLIVSYRLRLPISTPSLAITPTLGNVDTSVTVAGSAVGSGSSSGQLPLPLGEHDIDLVVAEPGKTPVTYTLHVDRGGTFVQRAYLKASNTGSGDRFGGRVALSGNTIAIAAASEAGAGLGPNADQGDNTAANAGAVYVFAFDGAAWMQQAYLKASNTSAGDSFGARLALHGDLLVVSALGEDGGSTGQDGDQADNSAGTSGAVYVFERQAGSWSQQAYLKAPNTNANDYFGISLALSDTTLVVGASGESSSATGVGGDLSDNSALNAGAVYVFQRNGASWQLEAYLKASNAESQDFFGWSVAMSGNLLVVGAWGEDSGANTVDGTEGDNSASSAGAAYVFERVSTSWTQRAYLKASNAGADDRFGASVAVSGETVVVGAPSEASGSTGVGGGQLNDDQPRAGAAYVFARSGGIWGQQAYLKASNTDASDSFGGALALAGDLLVVGATGEDGSLGAPHVNSATGSGAAYLFSRSAGVWSQRSYLKAALGGAQDSFGESVSIFGTTIAIGALGEASVATGVDSNQSDDSASFAGAVYLME